MENKFESLDEILYDNYRPWLDHNCIDIRFASMLSSIKLAQSNFKFKYAVEFERPFDHKTKYYNKRINHDTQQTIHRIHALIAEQSGPKVIKYLLGSVKKELRARIRETGKLIKKMDFSLSYIDPKKFPSIDQNHKANTFVIQLLKNSLIHIYLEIQEAFPEYAEDRFISDDFFTQLLLEPVPDKTYLKEIKTIVVNPLPIKQPTAPKKKTQAHSFKYKQFATAPTKLADLHNGLKKSGLIDGNTTITNFKKIFSGNEISTPIIWTGNSSELSYFIKLIHNEYKVIEDLSQQQWKVTCKCFVPNANDSFVQSKLRFLKRPNATAKQIESLATLLK